jgi:hypothetical protein
MKKSLMLGFVALVAVSSLYGRTQVVTAKIDFPFMAAEKTLPAGTYVFELQPSGDVFRVLRENESILANVVTRLGKEPAQKGAHLVFDKLGEDYLLSEIWIPNEDGFLLLATKGVHTHKTLGAL